MKLETFFEKFDQFADTPNAVDKMRDLVLKLAVFGKLVSQNPADDSASILLENVRAQRTALVSNRKIKARTLGEVRAEYHPFDLPLSWRWARLGDVGYQLGQKVPDRRFTYIDVGSIDSRKGRVGDDVQVLEPKDAPSRARKLVAQGTVIYSTIRPYLSNIAVIDHNLNPEPIASTAFAILHPFAGMDSRYLFYWLRSPLFTAYAEGEMKGMAYPAINDEKFYAGYVPVPPSAEQKRIVAKVDELMALCNRLEAQQRERETRHIEVTRAAIARFEEAPTPANLNLLFHPSCSVTSPDLRKTILNVAVRGKLLPQDPADETVTDLIRRIEHARSVVRARVYPAIEPSEAPFEIPVSWSWVRLGNIALHSDSGWSPQCDPQAREGDAWGVLKVSAVSWGRFLPEENKALPLDLRAREECEVKAGDFLVSRANTEDLVARSVVVIDTPPHLMMSDKIVRFAFPDLIDKGFINLVNSASFAREYYSRNASGTSSSMKNVGRDVMSNLPVPLPPLEEQRRIVAKTAALFELLSDMEKLVTSSRSMANDLADAIVSELVKAGGK